MRQYRIGLLAVHSDIDYPRSLRMGVQNTVEEAGHTLVALADLIPYHTLDNAEAYLRVACELAARLDIDVLVAPVGCMTANLSGNNAKAIELLQCLDPARTLVLEREVPGFRCVTKDNEPGMRECMRHLIETCGYTRIAFVSGPETSKGAHEREAIYFEEMEAHGLPTPPSLFARGDFGGDCADVIEKVLDDNPDVEAIACACDLIAYTTYAVLRKRRIAVGEDVAVTGFDDHVRSAHMDPPLSTVRMTAYDYGCMAAHEALRMCEGLPQKEKVMTSSFVARSSCGEGVRGQLEQFRALLRQKPFPFDEFVSIMVESSLSMAGPRVTSDFRAHMETFFAKVRTAYLRHREAPQPDDLLFSSHDLATLFQQDYRAYLSLEGFHTVAITLLEALLEESPSEDANWVIEQISHLHLRMARLLNDAVQDEKIEASRREWISFHMVDDALREVGGQSATHRLILGELARLGVREAALGLLPEPVEFMGAGARAFALSDTVLPVGSIAGGNVEVTPATEPIMLQELLDHVLLQRGATAICTVGGIMAGNELLGVAVFMDDALDLHGQLMALLNLGFAFKHLQMLSTEREMNQLLNQNNLLLKQESQHDEMTGLLNRRGLKNRAVHLLPKHVGEYAAVFYLDLDGLKTINDTLGHDLGDEAIKATARILADQMPKDGLLSRLGGDEFCAIALMESQAQVDQLVSDIQLAMDDFNISHDVPYTLSISVGAVLFCIDEDTESRLPSLMVEADTRLYEMKRHHHAARSS